MWINEVGRWLAAARRAKAVMAARHFTRPASQKPVRAGMAAGKLVRRGNLNGSGKQKACSRWFLFLHRRKVRPPALLPHAGEGARRADEGARAQIGRASCRERVCQYV